MLQIEAVAVEFRNARGGHYDAGRLGVFDDVEGEEEALAEGG